MDCPFVLVSCLVIGRWLTIAIEYYVMLVIFLSVFLVCTNQRPLVNLPILFCPDAPKLDQITNLNLYYRIIILM
ncbi:hypothetical protein VNO80_11366 [Phaseolus coccineus]|uniref:Uncharacterized protein n=1 Tax=Phaseolus coccineus TaxID=3886 RepID=A0AAN9NA04_PHACN